MGDTTAHGGTIAIGFPTVLIGGQPAARLTDMHVCPMMTPATPPIPHVGGPVLGPGVPTVLIGNMPAVTMGDMATCVGPPDVIVMGCPTVILGMAGAGAGSAGAAGGGGAGAANASAAAAQFDNLESVTKEKNWIEFEVVDKAGLPVSGVAYKFTDPDGKESESMLRLDGRIRRDAVSEGKGELVLMSVSAAKWSKETAKPGDELTLRASVEGFEDGTQVLFQIFKRDISGADSGFDVLKSTVQGEKAEASWTYVHPETGDGVTLPPEGAMSPPDETVKYSAPDYYFDVIVGPCKTRSGLLHYADFIEVEVVDEEGEPLSDEEYVLFTANGEVRKGRLDGSGLLKEDNLSPGLNKLRFPHLPDLEIDL